MNLGYILDIFWIYLGYILDIFRIYLGYIWDILYIIWDIFGMFFDEVRMNFGGKVTLGSDRRPPFFPSPKWIFEKKQHFWISSFIGVLEPGTYLKRRGPKFPA